MAEIDHIGIVVDELGSAIEFLEKHFGLAVERTVSWPERGVEAVFLPWGSASLEMIEHHDPKMRADRLGDSAARIDHVAIRVDDVDVEAERLRALGLRTMTPESFVLGGRRTIFIDPDTADGVRYQLVE